MEIFPRDFDSGCFFEFGKGNHIFRGLDSIEDRERKKGGGKENAQRFENKNPHWSSASDPSAPEDSADENKNQHIHKNLRGTFI